MRYHSQNLTDGKLPMWQHGRAWWGRLHWEWAVLHGHGLVQAAVWRWGFSIYFGKLGSLWVGAADERVRPRWGVAWTEDWSIHIDHPWCRQDEWHARDPWWRKSITISVWDWIAGKLHVDSEDGKPIQVYVPMAEGSYRAKATPKTWTRRRRWWRKVETSWWLDIPGGIPYQGKGENSWDCGADGLWGAGGDTLPKAIANCVASVLDKRDRYGYVDNIGRAPTHVATNQWQTPKTESEEE